MDTRKMIPVEQLQYSPIFMGELYRKMSYLPKFKSKIDDYVERSETIYFILNQKQWKDNDCSFFLQMSDGREHSRLEMEQPFNTLVECWRFQIEVYYRKNADGKAELVVRPKKILIQRASEMDIEFTHTASEREYIDNLKAEEETIINAKKHINK